VYGLIKKEEEELMNRRQRLKAFRQLKSEVRGSEGCDLNLM
jgi:hypothetical protein